MRWVKTLRNLIRRRSGLPLPILHVLWERHLAVAYRRQALNLGFGMPLRLEQRRLPGEPGR